MYTFANQTFETKFLVVGRENGCSKCKNLKSFLTNAMEGKYDSQITQVMQETDESTYDAVVEATGSMSLPIMVDLESGNFITGFNVPEVLEMLGE